MLPTLKNDNDSLRKNKMYILFVSRKFPPSIGGMEKVSYRLSEELSSSLKISLIALRKSHKHLIFFILQTFFKSLYFIHFKKVTHLYIADGLLAPLGLAIKCLSNVKVVVTIHGLDITFKNRVYQYIIPRCVKKLDSVVCISEATKTECINRGVPETSISVIPWGVYPNEYKVKSDTNKLKNIAGTQINEKKVIVTVGRLVERKGVYWFVENVVPLLSNCVYLVVGSGSSYKKIERLIKQKSLENKVKLLGNISDEELRMVYSSSDLFVMPNISIANDIEGFGMVALEAASANMRLVLSDIDGISEAAKCISNVSLVKPGDKSGMIKAIKKELSEPKSAQKVRTWDEVGIGYVTVFSNL